MVDFVEKVRDVYPLFVLNREEEKIFSIKMNSGEFILMLKHNIEFILMLKHNIFAFNRDFLHSEKTPHNFLFLNSTYW